MNTVSTRFPGSIHFVAGDDALLPPPWVQQIFGEHASLFTSRITNATSLDPASFQSAVIRAYTTIRESLGGLHAVRFWNHIPAIHAVMDADRDRYMVFNSGRYRAFENWFGSCAVFSRDVPTASGVGHTGSDLVIHCLATSSPGEAIENPRQIASYRYSGRYGPLPPCFARATRVQLPHHPHAFILVGGTASIRGEDSIHRDSLSLQLDETFENLNTLAPLRSFRHLRIYFRQDRDLQQILDSVASASPILDSAQVIQAELCRSELLVEIEGLAEV